MTLSAWLSGAGNRSAPLFGHIRVPRQLSVATPPGGSESDG